MKILAIADRPPRRSIKEILSENPVDLIVTLGDLTLFDIEELKTITDIPKIGVYGNHCSGKYFESLGIWDMHMKTFEYMGLKFGGFEGSVRYKSDPGAKMFTQTEASRLLANFPYVDVMLSHAPSYGINDEPGDPTHAGLQGLRDYLEREKPRYLLHGHTYPSEEERVDRWGETNIIYVYQDKIIELV